ncbi:uncharacterized protein LOC123708030 [Pieris brassicae]|uniref:uncharacterized protein LOC123708030 n=1 Tax=Pieris brassicae TaxID=7116 RepID=UPI001E660BB4|nr:uncharacterized protein LOC123708030 [Pieris brassicae]
MYRSKGGMGSSRYCLSLFVALHITLSDAGPVGPLPNVTSVDLGLKEGSCALGDVVYLHGDQFPGTNPCEHCACTGGEVRCEKQRCEPRPGCKAVHRPDHCCPTYQCECEQEGHVYGNGEKLVDPQDPCRVCYCQGGEVVCRRIACFVRDDCQPRLVQGRCCPEYDNCPLRGVTSVHGVTQVSTTLPPKLNTSAVLPPPGPIKPGFTIKEITPVSEIPVTDVKVKEILPSPNMDVDEYSSSKSPLIPREVTSETSSIVDANVKAKLPVNIEKPEQKPSHEEIVPNNDNGDSTPSKISFSTQDSINSEIYPSNIPSLILMGPPSESISLNSLSTKSPALEEEDSSLFDHNPAFPPIPDDLSVPGNHEDEILPEQHFDNDQISGISDVMVTNDRIITDAPIVRESPTSILYMPKELGVTTDNLIGTDISSEKKNNKMELSSTDSLTTKENPMLNLRSVLPTQILNIPSFITDETTDDIDTTTDDSELQSSSEKGVEIVNDDGLDHQSSGNETDSDFQTPKSKEFFSSYESSTEIYIGNQPSSILIETSDQNPHDESDNISDSILASSTLRALNAETESDITTLSRMEPGKEASFENIETTEFMFTSFGSQESATEAVELMKMATDTDRSSALIKPSQERNINVLTDLINLVGDVASISDHTDNPTKSVGGSTTISDSEELIPVNLGYKSKNSNWNLNSITEIPHKSKNVQTSKTKNVEIEDDDEIENITDSPPPNDKIEPTTKRPVIDDVSDGKQQNISGSVENKDIEIITQAYVPTFNKRPTKVVMGNSSEALSGSQLTDSGKATFDTSDEEKDSKHLILTSSHRDAALPPSVEETERPLDGGSLAQ